MTVKSLENNELVNKVLQDPEAPAILKKIAIELEKEQEKREQFYNSIKTEEYKTEFINGQVIIHSPVKKIHNDISSNLFMLLNAYVAKYDLGFVGYEKIMIRLTRNDYEPDVCYFNKKKSKEFNDETSLFPPPNLAIEIASPKTSARDRNVKYYDYERHGVDEYWIISPKEKIVEQYVLDKKSKSYKLKKKSESGNIELVSIKGLKFPIECIFDRKLTQVEMIKILTYEK